MQRILNANRGAPSVDPATAYKQRNPEAFMRRMVNAHQGVQLPEGSDFASFAGDTVSNIPASTGNLLKGMYESVRHPIDTASALGDVAIGASQKLGRTLTDRPIRQDLVPVFDQAVDAVKGRYGGAKETLDTVRTDPVGALADVAGLASGGGMALSKLPRTASVGSKLAAAGSKADPLSLAARGVKKGANVIGNRADPFYASSVKLPAKMPRAERTEVLKQGLKNKVPVTVKGADKLQESITSINKTIADDITKATDSGALIPVHGMAKRAINALDDIQINTKERASVVKELESFIDEHSIGGLRKNVTPEYAQTLKKKLNKRLKSAYESQTVDPISKDTLKRLNKGVRQSLEDLVPELKNKNFKLGNAVKLKEAIERRLGAPSPGSVGHLGGLSSAAATTIAAVLGGKGALSKIAIKLDKLKNAGGGLSPAAVSLLSSLRAAGHLKEIDNE